jgi:hypothetical protein
MGETEQTNGEELPQRWSRKKIMIVIETSVLIILVVVLAAR